MMDDALRAELLRRAEVDQAARIPWDAAAAQADEENLPWLKDVVARLGWPGKSLVGVDGAEAAWLLAQHADRDPAFQRRCLDLIAPMVETGEVSRRDVAYLTDRVLLAEHRPQVYGTQVVCRDGVWQPQNLGKPDEVDQRRAAVGLGPLAEYLLHFEGVEVPESSEVSLECGGCSERVLFQLPESWDGDPFVVTCGACGMETTVRAGG